MKLDFHTDSKDYEYIHSWMESAFEKRMPGFDIIHNVRESDFTGGNAMVYRYKGKAEAFLTCSIQDKQVTIYLLALNPSFHHKGVGTKFFTEVIDYFRKKNVLVINAFEPSRKGLRLVKKLNFKKVEIPNDESSWMNLYIGDKCRKQCHIAKRKLTLWKGRDTKSTPFRSWSLNFTKCKKPIFSYAYKDWTLGIIQDDDIIYSAPVKYFEGLDIDMAYGYIYITEDLFPKRL